MKDQEYSIQELCDLTGLPRRTIHFYSQQEIIPPPVSSGLGARYQHIHLVRLNLIPVLRQQGLRLDDIRQKFIASSPEELESLLSSSAISNSTPKYRSAPMPVSPPTLVPQTYQVYNLPRGVILMVPVYLSPVHRSKIEDLCRTIERVLVYEPL